MSLLCGSVQLDERRYITLELTNFFSAIFSCCGASVACQQQQCLKEGSTHAAASRSLPLHRVTALENQISPFFLFLYSYKSHFKFVLHTLTQRCRQLVRTCYFKAVSPLSYSLCFFFLHLFSRDFPSHT